MLEMCSDISPNIKVIKTEFDNLTPTQYSKMLSNIYFWDFFVGEKILIYQEDSIIFKNNIEDFLDWDYIGAPWPIGQNDNKAGVGNGGISLRTRSIMKEIIQRISIQDTIFNSSTQEYINNAYQNEIENIGPEDVYFSKNMEDLNIGLLADRESAMKFSTETIINTDSFAGHNFWLNDPNWKQRIYDNIIIQFQPTFSTDENFSYHRGGWKSVIKNLINNNFYSKKSDICFFDLIEHNFLFKKNYRCDKKWFGIIHCTPKTPDYLYCVNIKFLFTNNNFIYSLKNCIGIFTLSNYISKYISSEFNKLDISINIHTLKHPVEMNNIIPFSIDLYIKNKHKKIIQIGQQLRKVSSIYFLENINEYDKIWLTGNKDFTKCKWLLDKEIKYLKLDKILIKNDVKMYYTQTFEEYDDLLSKNIVFIELFDAAANNTVIECIIRNTPLIINRIEGVVDYLGEEYPLYYNNKDEIPELLKIDNIMKGYEYLRNMNKEDLQISYFIKQLYTIIFNTIHKKI
jgi:hypothetical protein